MGEDPSVIPHPFGDGDRGNQNQLCMNVSLID